MNIEGLSEQEVAESRRLHGDNRLTEHATESFWDKLWDNFNDPIIKILCVALIINVVFAFMGQAKWYESVGIAMAVLIATLVSTFSEYRNENAFQSLQADASRILCKVYRSGNISEIAIDDIVVGDCVLLQTGDKIPADGVIIQGHIQVDQSVLNGESEEIEKTALSDSDADQQRNLLDSHSVYRGAIVAAGNAVMRVTIVGDESEYGRIAGELQTDEERDTPLKLKLGKLADDISKFGYYGGTLIAIAYMFQRIVIQNGFDIAAINAYCSNWMIVGHDLIEAVMLAVIIIVVAVPEGLPLMIAIVSAQNMGKMLKENVLVRKLSGIETAGSLNILFSDKTGTITKGQLEVVTFLDGQGRTHKATTDLSAELGRLVSLSIRQNTAAVVTADGQIVGGNGTDRALLSFIRDLPDEPGDEVVDTVLFNSTNKYSAAQIRGRDNLTLIKGAPERIIDRCTTYYDETGHVQPLITDMLNAKLDELAGRAIRLLAVATTSAPLEKGSLPDGEWTLVGVVGIRDEVRPESITALEEVRRAGVQVVMITGDRRETAAAIAKECGLVKSADDVVITSDELAAKSDEEIVGILPRLRVVARALPSDKSRLVRIAKSLNLVVGMTGDGVNDSPALKQADVGFAMGGGTEVAKEASEIVILDDNFKSIERAVLYGRTIYNNIRKFVVFQLTINVAAVGISFVAPLLGFQPPLTITQMLWVNLVMDTLAALALSGEPALAEYMREKPKRRDENIISKPMWTQILTGATWTFALSLVYIMTSFASGFFRPDPDDMFNKYLLTGYFSFFILIAVCNAFNVRTNGLNLLANVGRNPGFIQVMGLIVIVQVIMTYLGGEVLSCYGLVASEWGFVIVTALTIIPVDMIRKIIIR